MRLETIRMNAAAAADPVIGINAMIAALPIDAGDVRPGNHAIYNQADHTWLARKTVSKGDDITLPAIGILLQPSNIKQVNTTIRDAQIPVIFAYLTRNPDSAEAQRDCSYAMRALLRFLRRFADNANAAMRTRNGVQLLHPIDDVQQGEAIQPWNGVTVIAATELTWLARETAA